MGHPSAPPEEERTNLQIILLKMTLKMTFERSMVVARIGGTMDHLLSRVSIMYNSFVFKSSNTFHSPLFP